MTITEIGSTFADPTDPTCHDTAMALAEALIGVCQDIHQPTGEAGDDAAIRAAMRAMHDALTDDFGCATAAYGALRQALDEIGHDITESANSRL